MRALLQWVRKFRYEPHRPTANPGLGSTTAVPFPGEAQRFETLDLVGLLSSVLYKRSVHHRIRDGWLVLPNGIMLKPEFVSLEPRRDGAVRTSTTISVCHQFHIPIGLFEYQHAIGDTVIQSMAKGFDSWVELDLRTLMEAVKGGEIDCMTMVMDFPSGPGRKSFRRRVVLGPTMHCVRESGEVVEEEHPFCPCCLFTNSISAFKELLESDDFFGLRLFASRDADGIIQADCRVNGMNWPGGTKNLLEYIEKWPARGFEFRKQFVVIQSCAAE